MALETGTPADMAMGSPAAFEMGTPAVMEIGQSPMADSKDLLPLEEFVCGPAGNPGRCRATWRPGLGTCVTTTKSGCLETLVSLMSTMCLRSAADVFWCLSTGRLHVKASAITPQSKQVSDLFSFSL